VTDEVTAKIRYCYLKEEQYFAKDEHHTLEKAISTYLKGATSLDRDH